VKPRIIDPSFWEDLDIIELTRDERLLLTAMITAGADDHGRLKANPAYLKRLAFAFDDDLGLADTDCMVLHIGACCKNLQLYEVKGERYAVFANWQKYQGIKYQRASVLPEPPIVAEPVTPTASVQDFPTLENLGQDTETFSEGGKSWTQSRVGLGCVGQGRDGLGCAAGVGLTREDPEKRDDNNDNSTAPLFQALSQAGRMVSSLEAERWVDLAAEYDVGLLVDCVVETARLAKQPSPAYVGAMAKRCTEQGCLPGQWPKGKARASSGGPQRVPEIDYAAYGEQLEADRHASRG